MITRNHTKKKKRKNIYYICKKMFEYKYTNDKSYGKGKDHCHYAGK